MAISICTTVGHIKPNPECYLQRGSRLQNLEDKALAEFSLYRGAYISEKLMEVKDEQLYSNNGFLINDYVDMYTVKDGKCNVCCKCFGSFPKSDVKCPHCGINMERYEND